MDACMCESQGYFFVFRDASSLSLRFPFELMQVDEKLRSSIAHLQSVSQTGRAVHVKLKASVSRIFATKCPLSFGLFF